METNLGELRKLPIKRLKEVISKLIKEKQTDEIVRIISLVKEVIKEKKRRSNILHRFKVVDGKRVKDGRWMPAHLI